MNDLSITTIYTRCVSRLIYIAYLGYHNIYNVNKHVIGSYTLQLPLVAYGSGYRPGTPGQSLAVQIAVVKPGQNSQHNLPGGRTHAAPPSGGRSH